MARGVSLLIKCTLQVDHVHFDAGGRGLLVVADIAVNSTLFQIVAIYAPSNQMKPVSIFHWLGIHCA